MLALRTLRIGFCSAPIPHPDSMIPGSYEARNPKPKRGWDQDAGLRLGDLGSGVEGIETRA